MFFGGCLAAPSGNEDYITTGRARTVDAGLGVEERLQAAVLAYLEGPTPEETKLGLYSPLGKDKQDGLTDVQVDSAGHAVIDLNRAAMPGSTSSAQSVAIWADLEAVAFQFDTIVELEPRLEGSCQDFGDAMQAGVCLIATRTGPQAPIRWHRS